MPLSIWAALDRIESGMAVLVLDQGGQELVIPIHLLPDGAREGDVYRIGLHPDEEEKLRRLNRVRSLQDRLRRRGGNSGDPNRAGP